MNQKKIDSFYDQLKTWKEELLLLRSIVLDCGLAESYKWNHPCYTYKNHNIALIHGFKDYCALSFFKGALLKDTEGILVQQTKNVQGGRQLRFTSLQEIITMKATIKAYLYEAIEVEKAGLKVEYKKTEEFDMPEELRQKLDNDPELKSAFEALTPGRQRGYLLHFAGAKQSKTRAARIEKYIPKILDGKGLNDCTCGLSKRYPQCDGSHNNINR